MLCMQEHHYWQLWSADSFNDNDDNNDNDDDNDDDDDDNDDDKPLLSEPADESQTLNSTHGERRAEASLYKLYKCIFNINTLIALI